jgi:hypothetical protein
LVERFLGLAYANGARIWPGCSSPEAKTVSESFRKILRTILGVFRDIRSRRAQVSHQELPKSRAIYDKRITKMSQVAENEMSAFEPTPASAIANHNFAVAAALLGIVLLLVATQLIFVGHNPDVIEAAASASAIGIIAP